MNITTVATASKTVFVLKSRCLTIIPLSISFAHLSSYTFPSFILLFPC